MIEPTRIDNYDFEGIFLEFDSNNSTGKIIKKKFLSSDEKNFKRIADNLFDRLTSPYAANLFLNELVIIIKPDNKAYLYKEFPLSFLLNVKGKKNKNDLINTSEIIDIKSASFSDDSNDINPNKNDKIIFLFRSNWKFGLYFDFTRNIDVEKMKLEIGYFYKRILYSNIYEFLENESFMKNMINYGWFPFIHLFGEKLDYLNLYFDDPKNVSLSIEEFFNKFDNIEIDKIIQKWWNNTIFLNKKRIIEAGINSYLQFTQDGFINAINTLLPQIDGILRLAYHDEIGDSITFNKLISFIRDKAKEKYKTNDSLVCPELFFQYLKEYIFQSFDLKTGTIKDSRNAFLHGVASDEMYTKEFCIKVILTLDNLYYFLPN